MTLSNEGNGGMSETYEYLFEDKKDSYTLLGHEFWVSEDEIFLDKGDVMNRVFQSETKCGTIDFRRM